MYLIRTDQNEIKIKVYNKEKLRNCMSICRLNNTLCWRNGDILAYLVTIKIMPQYERFSKVSQGNIVHNYRWSNSENKKSEISINPVINHKPLANEKSNLSQVTCNKKQILQVLEKLIISDRKESGTWACESCLAINELELILTFKQVLHTFTASLLVISYSQCYA